MKLIVGLGNPGKQYAETRHNVGFKVIDLLAERISVNMDKLKEQALVAETTRDGKKILLVKPQTYMNLSGQAVGRIARWYKVEPQNILVIYDDLDLPVGQLRIRTKGGAGGHKGIASIMFYLGTVEFPRIRLGIGRPPEGAEVSEYVLDRFLPSEKELITSVLERGADAVQTWLEKDVTAAMNQYSK